MERDRDKERERGGRGGRETVNGGRDTIETEGKRDTDKERERGGER